MEQVVIALIDVDDEQPGDTDELAVGGDQIAGDVVGGISDEHQFVEARRWCDGVAGQCAWAEGAAAGANWSGVEDEGGEQVSQCQLGWCAVVEAYVVAAS